ncbi:hypothetical protein ACNJ7E_34950 [Rhodococcus sp. NM-2]|uniref:hypothetical protein n=1 Tax=Rhodococcus sp. NM-2 TaxID=3401174 RepID=UPI003AAD7FF9
MDRDLKALKLRSPKDILPQRLALARQHQLSHLAFLELFGPTKCHAANRVRH